MPAVKIFNPYDSPWSFNTLNKTDKCNIEYRDLIEFSQGSPLIGRLYVNEKELVKNNLFGSPFIYFNERMYVPMFIRRFFSSGFILCEINFETEKMRPIGKIKNLICLSFMENNIVTYFTDIEKTKKECVYI